MDQTIRLGVTSTRAAATPIGDAVRALATAPRWSAPSASPRCRPASSARALDMTVAYSKERVQFGRPIGSFQALKHRMADMLVLVEMSRSASWAASYAVSTDAAERRAARARREVVLLRRAHQDRRARPSSCTAASRSPGSTTNAEAPTSREVVLLRRLTRIAAETVQLHGGIAITWEHDAQLVFKRAHALAQLFGSRTGTGH